MVRCGLEAPSRIGEVRTDRFAPGAVTQTDFGYSDQRDVESLGLMDYRARFYDPALGRFVQADRIIPGPAVPQSWNRYTYVLNNPVKYVDPTGYYQCEDAHECDISDWIGNPSNTSQHHDEPDAPIGNPSGHDWSQEEGTGCERNACLIAQPGNPSSPASSNRPTENAEPGVDPFGWLHVVEMVGGGLVLAGFGVLMVDLGVGMCAGVLTCILGGTLVVAGAAAVIEGGIIVYGGYQAGVDYYNELAGKSP